LRRWRNQGIHVQVLDGRHPAESAGGHAPGAKDVPPAGEAAFARRDHRLFRDDGLLPPRHAMRTSKGPIPSRPGAAKDVLAAAAVAVPFLLWGGKYLGQDLWWDEITALIYYSLQPIKETINHLESTNNHIFFSLVINVFTRMIGERDFYALIDRVPLLRGLQLACGAVTVPVHLSARAEVLRPGTAWPP
jgi:hypothetical protein